MRPSRSSGFVLHRDQEADASTPHSGAHEAEEDGSPHPRRIEDQGNQASL